MRKLLVVAVGVVLAVPPEIAWPKGHVTPNSGRYLGHTSQTDSQGRRAGIGFRFAQRTVRNFAIQFRVECGSGHTLYAEFKDPRVGPISGFGLITNPRGTAGPVRLFNNTQGIERSSYFLAVIFVDANKITGQFQAHTKLFNASGAFVDDCRMRIASWSANRQGP